MCVLVLQREPQEVGLCQLNINIHRHPDAICLNICPIFSQNYIKLRSFTLSHYWMLTGGRYSDFEKGCIRKTLFFKIIVAVAAKFYMTSNFSSRVSQSVISVILVLMLNQAPIHNSQDNLWSAGRGETKFWLLQWHRNYTQKRFLLLRC